MEVYIETLAIVSGFLTPLAVLMLIRLGSELSQERRARHDRKRAEAEKRAPFDDEAEFYEVPNNTMIGVRLKKDGEVVWDGAVEKLDEPKRSFYL